MEWRRGRRQITFRLLGHWACTHSLTPRMHDLANVETANYIAKQRLATKFPFFTLQVFIWPRILFCMQGNKAFDFKQREANYMEPYHTAFFSKVGSILTINVEWFPQPLNIETDCKKFS